MNVAFIPVRGGSKSIPLKNIKPLCGKPLVYWTVKAACECKYIDTVYVATDSNAIKSTIETFCSDEKGNFNKVIVISRSAESASDTASTEFAMLEFSANYSFDNIVLIQATSPLLTAADIDNGFEIYNSSNTDSVMSVVRQKRFRWENLSDGSARPTNYDVFHRPRRQEFDGDFVENGAFYITSKELLDSSKNRVSGKIKLAELPEETFFEIDEPSDWVIIEGLMKKRINHSQSIPEIKMFLTDCDGCLTDGGMYYSEKGDELKKFCTYDGLGLRLLEEKGIPCGIVTGETRELNRARAQKLKLDIFEEGCTDKVSVIKRLSQEHNIPLENIAYMGDDLNDLGAIRIVGLSFAPANARPDIISEVNIVTKAKGGEGAVREAIDFILASTK